MDRLRASLAGAAALLAAIPALPGAAAASPTCRPPTATFVGGASAAGVGETAELLRRADRQAGSGSPAAAARELAQAAEERSRAGYPSQARQLLERAESLAREAGDPELLRRILGARASAQLEAGDPAAAADLLNQATALARGQGPDPGVEARLAITAGDVEAMAGSRDRGAQRFAQGRELALQAGDPLLAGQAAAKRGRALIQTGALAEAQVSLAQASLAVEPLPPSAGLARLRMHVAESWSRLAAAEPQARASHRRQAAELLGRALRVASAVGDAELEAFVLGDLGRLYEDSGRLDEAAVLTRRAIARVPQAVGSVSRFRWQWQLGRLRVAQGDPEAGLAAYRSAVATLDELRARGVELPDEGAVEPVYLGLVDQLLQRAVATPAGADRTALLVEARDRVDDLSTEELREYFEDSCLGAERLTRAESIPGATVVHIVPLPDRTELLVSRGFGLERVAVPLGAEALQAAVEAWLPLLKKRTTREYRRPAAELYDTLIRPLESVLGEDPGTLVFAPYGALRTVPLGALYDRKRRQFLIEMHPVAVIPALQLTEARSIQVGGVQTLLAGITVPLRGFPALKSVTPELEAIGDIFEGQRLVDDDFVVEAVEASLADESYGIVHIATHAQFGGTASESFLLTFDGQLDMDELGALVERTRFREEPIELLTLSACETAVGDRRAALGLAGIAVRAGARSALASLWTVNDTATAQLIAEFYRQLSEEGVSRAEALRRAQLQLLASRTTRHPGYWAAFLMISNWL